MWFLLACTGPEPAGDSGAVDSAVEGFEPSVAWVADARLPWDGAVGDWVDEDGQARAATVSVGLSEFDTPPCAWTGEVVGAERATADASWWLARELSLERSGSTCPEDHGVLQTSFVLSIGPLGDLGELWSIDDLDELQPYLFGFGVAGTAEELEPLGYGLAYELDEAGAVVVSDGVPQKVELGSGAPEGLWFLVPGDTLTPEELGL